MAMSFAPTGQPLPRPCEVARAFQELLGRSWPGPGDVVAGCSPEPPEIRDFPIPKRPGGNYVLCNGHLRDVLDAIGRARSRPSTHGTTGMG